jgi:hypothetical protein
VKLNLLLGFLVLTQTLSAQTFTETSPTPPFDGVLEGSIAFSDVDGDGDNDLVITGAKSPEEHIAKLYINDDGNFTEVLDTPFEGVDNSSIAFSDVDGDGDDDLLITGRTTIGPFGSFEIIAKLYANNGGSFTEVLGTPFEGVLAGSIAFSDVDLDGDDDLVITGSSGIGRIARLYTNDGGNFTEVSGTPFSGVSASSIAFSDVDGDGDEDLFITGWKSQTERIAKLYTNEGGSFTEVLGTPFDAVGASDVAFSDVDLDGDDDLLITGWNSQDENIAKLYVNDAGSFTEVLLTPFEGVLASSIAFSDVDLDGDNDLLITGRSNSDLYVTKLYTNNGGSFSEVFGTPFEDVAFGSIAFSDIDGDNDQDILITGADNLSQPLSKLYLNESMVSSTYEKEETILKNIKLFPNPLTSGDLNISLTAQRSNQIAISVYNIHGKLISRQKKFVRPGQNLLTIGITSLPAGNYAIHLQKGGYLSVSKFIIP